MSVPKRMNGVLLALLAVAVVVGMTAGAARAAIGVTVGEPTLSADSSSITVPVTVSCSPFDPSLTTFTTLISVTVDQGGKNVAHASGSTSAGYPSAMLFTCDGTNQTVNVTAVADANAATFHPGPAVVTVSHGQWPVSRVRIGRCALVSSTPNPRLQLLMLSFAERGRKRSGRRKSGRGSASSEARPELPRRSAFPLQPWLHD